MRMLMRNKQKMYYSQPGEVVPIYERDEDGNIKYVEVDGEQVPIETGETEMTYGPVVEFKANISAKLHDVIIRAFGSDDSLNYAQLICNKGEFPFVIGTRIWRTNDVEYNADGSVKKESANYIVRGILDEQLNEDMYYLKKISATE